MSKARIHSAALALASDGTVIANIRGYGGATDPEALLRRAIEEDCVIFIGVRLRAAEARDVLSRLDDHSHEAASFVLGARGVQKRKKAARDKRDPGRSKGSA